MITIDSQPDPAAMSKGYGSQRRGSSSKYTEIRNLQLNTVDLWPVLYNLSGPIQMSMMAPWSPSFLTVHGWSVAVPRHLATLNHPKPGWSNENISLRHVTSRVLFQYFLRVIPTLTYYSDIFWHSFWHSIWKYIRYCMYMHVYSDSISDIPSDIYSDILSDILSGIYSDILSGIFSCIHSGLLSGLLSGISSGPGALHSNRSWQEKAQAEMRRGSCTFVDTWRSSPGHLAAGEQSKDTFKHHNNIPKSF